MNPSGGAYRTVIPIWALFGSVSISDIPWVYLEDEEADKLEDIMPEDELYSRHADQYRILEDGAILE